MTLNEEQILKEKCQRMPTLSKKRKLFCNQSINIYSTKARSKEDLIHRAPTTTKLRPSSWQLLLHEPMNRISIVPGIEPG